MTEPKGPLRVARVKSRWRRADGTWGDCESRLLRRSWREGTKVKHHTVASLTDLPDEQVDALEAVLNHGARPAGAGAAAPGVRVGAGLRHGDVAAIWAEAAKLGLPGLLGPAGRMRDIVLALVTARLAHPASKAATLDWLRDTTLGQDLGLGDLATDDAYAAMDWLASRQDQIEAALAKRHLADPAANPGRLALFDLTSTWMEGHCCPWSRFGYSRDRKRGKQQIEFALVTNPDGVPVALRVFDGNTSDPEACETAVEDLAEKFAMDRAVLVGDRGMVTNTRIADIKGHAGMGWIGALKHAQIRALAADQGPLQMSLFDEEALAEIADDAYPGERLIACRNPLTAERQAAKRERLVAATLADLDQIGARVEAGRLKDEKAIALAVGKVIGKHKVAKLVSVEIGKGLLKHGRNREAIEAEAALDGVYVVRTSLSEDEMGRDDVVRSYKRGSRVEQDFASIKGDDIEVRPVWHYRADRVVSHLLICMLASYLSWHLRRVWAPLTFMDECPEALPHPVAPRERSEQADAKAHTRRDADGEPLRPFREVLQHLSLMQRVVVEVATGAGTVRYTRTTEATPLQARAFALIGAPVPHTLG
ncbi:MAG: IS1634 family transposase [Bifidobacteriaceae bacterium]|jgi:hypothetical protein|nr:IS1634 family transposase [Bifidobacteriaceae bacterium]